MNHKKLSNLLINSEFDSNITIANNANTTRNIIQRSLNINNIKFSNSNVKTKPAMRNSINKTNSKNQINQINHINNIEKDIQNVQRINSKKKIFLKMKSMSSSYFKMNKIVELKNKEMKDSSKNHLLENNSCMVLDKLTKDNQKESNDKQKQKISDKIINNSNKSINLSDNKNNITNDNKTIDNYILKLNKTNVSNLKTKENEINDNYQDIMLNKSNKNYIFFIKIYIVIIILFIVVVSIFSGYKIILTLQFKLLINNYFTDYYSITDRYTMLINYFNILRIIFIIPESKRKIRFTNLMENLTESYEEKNKKYSDILAGRIKNYKETKNLLEILQSKQNSTDLLNEMICVNRTACELYLKSKYNIFDSGVDFAYKTCINQISNIYMDYKILDNKTDINEIKEKLILREYSQFEYISASINNIFSYTLDKIFRTFRDDQLNARNTYSNNMTLLNIVSVMFSILTFLFVNIIIFFSLSIFSKPIKNSTYRINCSFHYIKKYTLNLQKN